MKKPKGKGKGQKPNAPKPKNTKQKQKQTQNVNVKINIGQLKKTRASKGSNVIHSYAPQPITSYPLYPLFRDEAPQPPPFRNIDNIPSNTLQNTPNVTPNVTPKKIGNKIPTNDQSIGYRGLDSIYADFKSPLDRWKESKVASSKSPSVISGKGSVFGMDDIYKQPVKFYDSPFNRGQVATETKRIDSLTNMRRPQTPPLTAEEMEQPPRRGPGRPRNQPLTDLEAEQKRLKKNEYSKDYRAKQKASKVAPDN